MIAGAVAAALLIVACRGLLPANRYLQPRRTAHSQSTADARGKFDHRTHAPTMAKADIVCGDCHRFDMLIETANEKAARALSTRALYPGGAACHYCHRPGDTKMYAAPGGCATCHDNLLPLRPEDHDVAWLKVHEAMARAQPESCEGCHRQADCIECHQRRDTIETVVHDRNFRFFHSIVARANPMQCSSCHTERFCISCHQEGEVD